tara:strand:- start:387 stop:1034 length:648 start_codon:yes stop_codon:yes gene_type:complete
LKKIFWVIILLSFELHCQVENWVDYELDPKVRFQLPKENASLFDALQDGIKMYEFSAEKDNVVYAGNKIDVDEQLLPSSKKELIRIYDKVNTDNSYPNATVIKKEISKNGLIGQKLVLTDSLGNRVYESEVYFFDDHVYWFNCITKNNSIIKDSDYFFGKISLPSGAEVNQLSGKSTFWKLVLLFKKELSIFFGVIVLIIGTIILIKKNNSQQRV